VEARKIREELLDSQRQLRLEFQIPYRQDECADFSTALKDFSEGAVETKAEIPD
jgi:hypothetical protein